MVTQDKHTGNMFKLYSFLQTLELPLSCIFLFTEMAYGTCCFKTQSYLIQAEGHLCWCYTRRDPASSVLTMTNYIGFCGYASQPVFTTLALFSGASHFQELPDEVRHVIHSEITNPHGSMLNWKLTVLSTWTNFRHLFVLPLKISITIAT